VSAAPAELGQYTPGISRALANLASAGASFTGAERLTIAQVARDGAAGVLGTYDALSTVVVEAASTVATASSSIDLSVVEGWEAQGLERVSYAELIGIVGRIRAIDTFSYGLGVAAPHLPSPTPGRPTGAIANDSRVRTGFVPVPRLLSPSRVVSALPADHAAQDDLSDTLYLSSAAMDDLTVVKDLDRAQMELVAARTSYVNDCHW